MNKDYLEALNWLLANEMVYRGRTQLPISPTLRDIKQYLEAIDNAKFSKSLEELKKVRDFSYRLPMVQYLEMNYALDTVQEALVKAQEQEKENTRAFGKDIINLNETLKQTIDKPILYASRYGNKYIVPQKLFEEQEKENAYIEKIKTMMKQKDCVLRYIESEDCFAVRTILSDGWYKLTPEFVENNVKEEIKPLPLIEKNRQLKEENAEYKRVLEIIKNKSVNMIRFEAVLMYNGNADDYNKDEEYQQRHLTQEEFDTLSKWLRKDKSK